MAAKPLQQLYAALDGKSRRSLIPFSQTLETAAQNPEPFFRDVFQLFYDMVHHYVPQGINEYPDDPENAGYVNYDFTRLLVEGADTPFFADRLFANRFMAFVDSLSHQRKKVHLWVGPPGSGKSTFLDNLLAKFEHYTRTPEGTMYETAWRIDLQKLGLEELAAESCEKNDPRVPKLKDYLVVPCPNHDHPIVHIPKQHRGEFLEGLLEDSDFKAQLFSKREYEWVFNSVACTICSSVYQALIDNGKIEGPEAVLDMLFARRYNFSRALGEGISVYNPGDKTDEAPQENKVLQAYLNGVFRDGSVLYLFSELARTNNGIFVVADVKGNNVDRLKSLHGIISDGVHRVAHIEERTKSIFLALINPSDMNGALNDTALRDRIIQRNVPYVLDYTTEIQIYAHFFGEGINASFLPRVLDNFAKVVISSRLKSRSPNLAEWIKNPSQYAKYCDDMLTLLKMDVYSGRIPTWLSDGDRKAFTAERRRQVIGEAEDEGSSGFSGREAIALFNDFYTRFSRKDRLITIDHIVQFFTQKNGNLSERLPARFLDALVRSYNYSILKEVESSLYNDNPEKISKDILNYIWATNHLPGSRTVCPFTNEAMEITEDYFKTMFVNILGSEAPKDQAGLTKKAHELKEETQQQYLVAMSQEVDGQRPLTQTEMYKSLYEQYERSLRANVLSPFVNSESFRRAIKDYGMPAFVGVEPRTQQDVRFMMGNLQSRFGYTEKGAREICLYVIEKNLVEAFK
ncbi:serine protein kinase PrkA [Candidatus Woesearchaeota archaeon]|nr:serine protein kinase PrkA [Candidatus Woesearchaeota archaeon]